MREDWAITRAMDCIPMWGDGVEYRATVTAVANALRQRDAAIKRLIKRLDNKVWKNMSHDFNAGHHQACFEILAAMTRPRKGGGGC